jgi:catechol 2,3-dioxygenase-like lactoylglutathione lyase family enzyme
MPIVGVETALYGVEDLAAGAQFFTDFGLPLLRQSDAESHFQLAEGSHVILRHINDASIPKSNYVGLGVKETIWGVDSEASLDRLANDLLRDREVVRDGDGVAHFLSDCGMALGLRVFDRKRVTYAPDPINAPGHINRLNQTRKWRKRALPKTLNHVVFGVVDYQASAAFFRQRLGFRLSDHQKGIGMYLRADGAHEHHNLFLMDCNTPGIGGAPRFHHANFGVEDIDELMIGANLLMSKGYQPGFLGAGRHRISSALFSYWQCPAGGEAEYGADSDYLDDNWVPREWEFRFGTMIWMQSPPPFLQGEIEWDVDFYKEFGQQ